LRIFEILSELAHWKTKKSRLHKKLKTITGIINKKVHKKGNDKDSESESMDAIKFNNSWE